MAAPKSSSLRQLAHAYGISAETAFADGGSRAVPAPTLIGLLDAFGVNATTDEACWAGLEAARLWRWKQVVPPVVVLREGWTPGVPVHLPVEVRFQVRLRLENNTERAVHVQRHVATRKIDDATMAESAVDLPDDLPVGYHQLTVTAPGIDAACPIIVTPQRLEAPTPAGWGLAFHLFAARSTYSWGIGDAADLADVGAWAASLGAEFVAPGPLGAVQPGALPNPSPYRPSSRRFVSPLFIRVEEVPEIGYLSSAERQLLEWQADDARALNEHTEVDLDAVWAAKRSALRTLFAASSPARRQLEFGRFIADGGEELQRYATYRALVEAYGRDQAEWPQELRAAASTAVENFANEHAEDVLFECWLAWVATDALRRTQTEVTHTGLSLGVVASIAPLSSLDGADAWAARDMYAAGFAAGNRRNDGSASVLSGAAAKPSALAHDGYRTWRAMLRSHLAYAGALRLEDVGMLFRQWWYPSDGQVERGTWVKFDHEAMLGIAILEASRAGVPIIAGDEDGVEEWMRAYLRERGIVTSRSYLGATGSARLGSDSPKDNRASSGSAEATHAYASLAPNHLPGVAAFIGDDSDVSSMSDTDTTERLMDIVGVAADSSDPDRAIGLLHDRLHDVPQQLRGTNVLTALRLSDLVADRRDPAPRGELTREAWTRALVSFDGQPISIDDLSVSRRVKRLVRPFPDPDGLSR